MVLWRRTGSSLETYWVERSRRLAFMAGFHAFPGGGLARSDAELERLASGDRPGGVKGADPRAAMPATVLDGVDLQPILEPGLAVCAARELFEETGVLLAGSDVSCDPAVVDGLRARLVDPDDPLDFTEVLAELELDLDLSELVYAGRWLTPPLGPVRFDNRFFALEWPADRPFQPSVVPGELVAGEWIDPGAGLERWRSGEVTTAPPILHILEVLAEEGLPSGLDRLRAPAEANAGPFRKIEFRPGVLMFPLRTPTLPPAAYTNAYLLGHGEMALVDPGSPYPKMQEALLEGIAGLQGLGRKLTAIWLTHHHSDHVGAVRRILEVHDVPVAAHLKTERLLRPRGLRVDRRLEDGDLLTLEGSPRMRFRVLHTPGHAGGHLAFLDEDLGSLVSGDLTAGIGTIVVDPSDGDMDDYLTSLARVRDLGVAALFPGHGPPTVNARAKLQEYLDHRAWREGKILAAALTGARDTESLLEAAYGDVDRRAWPLAARQLEAHLIRLRGLGKLD